MIDDDNYPLYIDDNFGAYDMSDDPESTAEFYHRNQKMSVEKKVMEIIAKQLELEPSEVTPEKTFIDDLGADSLDVVELVMTMEEEFKIEISDEDAEKIKTVEDAINYIKEKTICWILIFRRISSCYLETNKINL